MVTVAPLTETVGALAIIVLSIIGLAGTASATMVAIATIVIGAAILMQATNMASEYVELFEAEQAGAIGKAGAVGGGITLEFLAGGAGVVLGILALLTPVTGVLSAAALIIFGGTLLLSAGATARASELQSGGALSGNARALLQQTASVGSGAQIMIGVAAMVLGILALVGLHAGVLILVGELAIGAALLAVSAGNSVAGLMRNNS